jgi:hypothetical protein
MGNHIMGHHQTQVNSTSQRVSKVVVVEIRRQPIGMEVTKSHNLIIITTRVETIVAPNMNVVRG